MGLLPLAWVTFRRERRREYWWLAVAFGISFLADTTVLLWHRPWAASAIYPVSQTALVAAVFVERRVAIGFTAFLVLAALLGLAIEGISAPGLILHVAGWLVLTTFLLEQPSSPLRTALLIGFGANILPWVLMVLRPRVSTWELYQGVRAMSLGWFCYAQTV
jgi:hypothetical protein